MEFSIEEIPKDSEYQRYFQRERQNGSKRAASRLGNSKQESKEGGRFFTVFVSSYQKLRRYLHSSDLTELFGAGALFLFLLLFLGIALGLDFYRGERRYLTLQQQKERLLAARQALFKELSPILPPNFREGGVRAVSLSHTVLEKLFYTLEELDGESYWVTLDFTPKSREKEQDEFTDGALTLTGRSADSGSVIDLLERLEAEGHLVTLNYRDLEQKDGREIEFTLHFPSLVNQNSSFDER